MWLKAAIWLALLLSPTGYFLLLMMADRFQLPALPESVVVSLFCIIPVVALFVCGRLLWQSRLRINWKVAGLALTVLAMLFQVAVLMVIIISAITAAIAPAQ